ncbi:hypothetical protein Ancab_008084 [Ancistrocladus abbreviatus]
MDKVSKKAQYIGIIHNNIEYSSEGIDKIERHPRTNRKNPSLMSSSRVLEISLPQAPHPWTCKVKKKQVMFVESEGRGNRGMKDKLRRDITIGIFIIVVVVVLDSVASSYHGDPVDKPWL